MAVVLVAIATLGGLAWRSGLQPINAPEESKRPTDLAAPSSAMEVTRGPLFFTNMLRESRIDFVHVSGDSPDKPFPAANGSGVAAFDYDLDGHLDLLFLSGTAIPQESAPSAATSRCYRNRTEWQFEDVTSATHLDHHGYCAGVAVGDFDGDGFPDVYLNCFGPNQLFRNQGDGSFVEVGGAAGIADDGWGTSAAFLDYDNDGLLDLYVCNYAKWSPETNQYCGDPARRVRIFCNPTTVEPARHRLFHNDGNEHFHDAFDEAGLAAVASSRGQGVVATDVNQDGRIDLYVSNDLHPNSLFLNLGEGKFHDVSESSGTAHDYLGRNQAGMGVDAGDANRDGRFELFVTNYEGEHNAFYENLGNELFQDVSHSRGLAADSIPHIGWGTVFADFDLDGWPDIVVTNGHTDNNLKELGRDGEYHQPAGLWKNVEGRFSYCGGAAAGSYFAAAHVGRGLALADLDNDGDSDIIVAHKDARPALLRNDSPRRQQSAENWLRVRLTGIQSNRDAVGATVELNDGKTSSVQQIQGGRSYLSAHDLRLLFPVDSKIKTGTLEVRWPSGITQRLSDLPLNQTINILEVSASDPAH